MLVKPITDLSIRVLRRRGGGGLVYKDLHGEGHETSGGGGEGGPDEYIPDYL